VEYGLGCWRDRRPTPDIMYITSENKTINKTVKMNDMKRVNIHNQSIVNRRATLQNVQRSVAAAVCRSISSSHGLEG